MQDDDRIGDGPDQGRASTTGGAGRNVLAGRLAAAVLVGAYAWWAVGRPPFSRSATLAVVLAGGAAAVLAARRRRLVGPRRLVGSFAGWAVLAAVAAAWQLAAYAQHPRYDHPTLSSLANAALGSQPARAAAFVLWLAATVELARR